MKNPPYRRVTLTMVMAVAVICTLDKLIFAFAGPSIIHDLGLTPVEFGFAGSAFYFVYSFAGVAVGFLANRVKTKWILLAMSLLWAAAQFIVSFVSSFAALVASRVLLGAATGPATATTQHAGFKWYPANERIGVSTLIQVSMLLGGLLASAVMPLSIQHLGWRLSYLLLGVVSVVWVALWLPFGREGSIGEQAAGEAHSRVSYRRMLLSRSFLMIAVMGFIGYIPNVLAVSWLPVFLQKGVGLSPAQMSAYLISTTLAVILTNLIASARSKRALQRGASFRKAMVRPALFACMVGGAIYLGLQYVGGSMPATLALFFAGSIAINIMPAFGFAIVAYLSPDSQRASMLAIYNGIITTGGILAPALIGYMISATGGDVLAGFGQFFTVCGAVAVGVSILALMVLDPEKTRKALDQDAGKEAHLQSPASV
ncbi:major facilitator superfamily protein 27 [Achromobacter xylosoxidans A8]|uniref:Major facilitator superfamily protein 27 n=1 Tax=Achromobacter xylosoxidans (strain A8) TaxID=762376 RepID=E3HFR2_ACHXA|nr:MFS transporter [Achromobacter xylosoxidans]ADP16518.1 major facilitator superfamily protein 27 [Achromobacter xylosoxidans A8]